MDKLELIDSLIKSTKELQYGEDINLDALKRRADMIIKKLFGDNCKYLKELKRFYFFPIIGPNTEDGKVKAWQSDKEKMLNFLGVIKEDLKLPGLTVEENHVRKENIRPIYSELQGYLKVAPTQSKDAYFILEASVWTQYNETVSLLSKISGNDYGRFIIEPEDFDTVLRVPISEYRQKLSGLISRLHTEYFADESSPFSEGPNTIITLSQQQNQSMHLQILEFQNIIDKKIPNYEDGTKEKSFLQKLKSSINSISNITQLLQTIHKMAKEFGLNLDDVSRIFS